MTRTDLAKTGARATPPQWCMDYMFLARAEDPERAKAVLNCLDERSGAMFAAMVHKGGDPIRTCCDDGGAEVHRAHTHHHTE